MNKFLIIVYFAFYAVVVLTAQMAFADDDQNYPSGVTEQSNDTLFTAMELDDLLAPIALYPDPLLAQILPAATFVDQIDLATRYVRQYGRLVRIDDQPWDISVKSVAHYPELLNMMDQKYDWTASLGQAYVNQQQDVMDAIQRLRADAQAQGNLFSTSQQQVVVENGYISIVPAAPGVIFVPQYDPQIVYVQSSPSYGFITFGIGFTIGAWLDRDCDWHGHRIFYHGWRGGGWISRARPFIHDQRNIYINNRYSVINVNRRVIQHNTVNFRENLRRNVQIHRKEAPSQASRPRNSQPSGKVEKSVDAARQHDNLARIKPGTQVESPRSVSTVTHPVGRPDNGPLYRGRETKEPQPAARSGYGGYGSAKDAATYRDRGQLSRENMGKFNSQQSGPAQSPRRAPAQRPTATQGRQAAPKPAAQPSPRKAPPANRGGKQEQH